MILPDEYLSTIADAVHAVGGIFVLDCIASGTIWVDMQQCGVDVLISAPQKGWSGTPCCALVMMGPRAVELLETTSSSSFSCDLKKWREIMSAYEQGAHAYHATMPTDGLRNFRDVMFETKELGFLGMENAQHELGKLGFETSFKNTAIPVLPAWGMKHLVWLSPIPLILTLKMAANSKRKDFR